MPTTLAHRAIRPPAQRQVVSRPARAGRASCMRQRIQHTVTALVHTYSTRPAPWNRPPRRHSRHPSAEGNVSSSRRGISSPPLEGWHVVPGWLEISRNRTYFPLSSRAIKKSTAGVRPQTTSILYTLQFIITIQNPYHAIFLRVGRFFQWTFVIVQYRLPPMKNAVALCRHDRPGALNQSAAILIRA